MGAVKNPFEVLVVEKESHEFAKLSGRPLVSSPDPAPVAGAFTARLHGFDLDDQPLVTGLPDLPDEIIPARTTVRFDRAQVGASVIVVFEHGDVRRPIVVGLLQEPRSTAGVTGDSPQLVSVVADDERIVISADREIVLRCGASSITLTRAGKVIIKGSYIVSRSTGVNKIKGAAVDIN